MEHIQGQELTVPEDIARENVQFDNDLSSIEDTLRHDFVGAIDFIKSEVLDNHQEQSVQKGTKYFVKQLRKCVRGNSRKLSRLCIVLVDKLLLHSDLVGRETPKIFRYSQLHKVAELRNTGAVARHQLVGNLETRRREHNLSSQTTQMIVRLQDLCQNRKSRVLAVFIN